LALVHEAVHPLYIRAGLVWEKAELYALRRFLRALHLPPIQPLKILDLTARDLYGPHWSMTGRGAPGYDAENESVYLPGRNILLLAKSAVFCALHQIPTLALAPLLQNPFPDSRPEFFRQIERVLARGLDFPLRLRVPFARLSKRDVILRGRHLPLELTFSCIAPKGLLHCGACTKCAERQRAFRAAEVEDRTPYRRAKR
jgi:7-cyano-7-deazaguanine synthase